MRIQKMIIFLFLILFTIQLSHAVEQVTLSPDGSHSNQNQINEALKNAGDSRTVILTSGEYEINGPIYVPRDVTIKGERGAKIIVSKDIQRPWFSPTVGVVNCFDPFNIKISGIEIDGNCQNLPSSWASSPGHAHDQEQLIKIIGSSGSFGQNIEISNTVLHNSFGDGIQARFIDGIISKDNEIINTQHESIYYSACKNCKMLYNRMAIITSDGGRFDNCVNGEAEGNIVWQYNGTNNNGAYKGGASAFQVGDAGSSKGYNGKKDWIHSTNIELHNNTIVDPGRKAFVVDAAGQTPSTNLYIHDNVVVGTEELEIMGISVSDNISVENPPSVELSEKVFSSIFDILSTNFTDSGRTKQKAEDFNYTVVQTEKGKVAGGIKIIGFNNWIKIDNESYISSPEDAIVKTSIVKAPSLAAWSGEISKVDKEVNISLENGTATATLTAKVEWYTPKANSKGDKAKGKLKKSEYKFTDTYYQAPKLFETPSNITGIVYQYPTYFTLYVPSKGLTSIEYKYAGNSSEHIFLVGETNTTSEGVKFTEYTSLEYWEGRLQHQGKWISVNDEFDESKLNITANTPYEQINVKNFTVIQKDFPTKVMADWLAPFFWIMIIFVIGCWYMFKQIWY